MTNTQVEDDKELNQEDTDVEWYRRANPNRAIYISGEINHDLVDRIQPEILKYRYESNEPITVYINSWGGNVDAADFIHGLLTSFNQQGERCHIITVATGYAASAAADLLVLGDYAIAYPNAEIYYHGSRISAELTAVTAERATRLANDMRNLNEKSASDVASSVIRRYLRMYFRLRDSPEFQQAINNLPEDICQNFAFTNVSENLFNVCAFAYFLSTQLSAPLDKLALKDASEQLHELNYVRRLRDKKSSQPTVDAWNGMIDQMALSRNQAESLKSNISIFQALLERRLNSIGDPKSGVGDLFDAMGWLTLNDEFNYVIECLNGRYSDRTWEVLIEFGSVLLSPDEIQEFNELVDARSRLAYSRAAAKPKLESLWFYAVTICRLLQKGEYPMKVEDAYWLGLINEIMGQGMPPAKE
jgi:ATP-dependent protease ClpP protease subunit